MQTLTASVAYDNFNIGFKTSEPTIEKQSTFVSCTSATAIPLFGVDDASVLQRSAELWQTDRRNPFSESHQQVKIDVTDLLDLHQRYDYFFEEAKDLNSLSSFIYNCAWHIQSILVHQLSYFAHFHGDLGEPKLIRKIPSFSCSATTTFSIFPHQVQAKIAKRPIGGTHTRITIAF
jgi:hypothetical protein